jgi:hypothetical protein
MQRHHNNNAVNYLPAFGFFKGLNHCVIIDLG